MAFSAQATPRPRPVEVLQALPLGCACPRLASDSAYVTPAVTCLHEQKIINGGRYLEPILITKSTITEKNASNFKLKESLVK